MEHEQKLDIVGVHREEPASIGCAPRPGYRGDSPVEAAGHRGPWDHGVDIGGEVVERHWIVQVLAELHELLPGPLTPFCGTGALVERVRRLDSTEPFRLLLDVDDEVEF